MKSGSEDAEKELISSGTILRILDLFFEWVLVECCVIQDEFLELMGS